MPNYQPKAPGQTEAVQDVEETPINPLLHTQAYREP